MADTPAAAPGPSYDSKTEAEQTGTTFVKMWLDALAQAEAEEKDWRDDAEKALKAYRGENEKGHSTRKFNIFHSNIETLCPALYNSTPAPDVRRRFNDPDPVAKQVTGILERALDFAVESYDFDAVMKAVIKDGEICGRGVPRVRYEPTFGPDGLVAYEQVTCDYVPWRYFRRGPGRTWKDVAWIAFGDFLTREQLSQLNPALAREMPLNYSADTRHDGKPGQEEQSIFRRALVWQIWDRDQRRVISLCPDFTEGVLAIVADPLGLTGFFPVPRPYQPVQAPDSLVPIVPYDIYKDLVEELNQVTGRIARLVKQLRPRGGYGGNVDDIKAISEADDGELVPLTGVEHLVDGGLEKWLTWFPLEPTVAALNALIAQREQIKQTIYEVTGIADILRGATLAAETATAQNIKAQWGSLRIQDRQAEVARLVRDLFRLKAEIIAGKFAWETLSQMTGVVLPDSAQRDQARMLLQQAAQAAQMGQQQQAPGMPGAPPAPAPQPPPLPPGIEKIAASVSREEAEQVLRSDILRAYRIDVESDSTIRGDLTRNHQNMSLFLQGTAQFAQAMGPILAQSPQAMPAVLEVYGAFARQFKLGKQAEDAIDSFIAQATQAGQGGPPQKPDPKTDAANIRAQAEIGKAQLGLQQAQAEHQASMAAIAGETQLKQADLALQAAKHNLALERLQAQQSAAAAPPMAAHFIR